MTEATKRTLKKWGMKLKRSLNKLGDSEISLNNLEMAITNSDADGAIAELQRLRKLKKKLK